MEPQHNAQTEHQLPEWEGTPQDSSRAGFLSKYKLFGSANADKEIPSSQSSGAGCTARFNGFMPATRKYLGLSRRMFLLALLGLLLVVLALALGLGIGLSKKSS
jgi:hypothetical protein